MESITNHHKQTHLFSILGHGCWRKKWNGTGDRWCIIIDMEISKFLLPRGAYWPNLKDSGWRFNLWRITLTASYNIYNWTMYHPLSVLFFLSRRIMIRKVFANMHSVCFRIFVTLVQPSVPGQILFKSCFSRGADYTVRGGLLWHRATTVM